MATECTRGSGNQGKLKVQRNLEIAISRKFRERARRARYARPAWQGVQGGLTQIQKCSTKRFLLKGNYEKSVLGGWVKDGARLHLLPPSHSSTRPARTAVRVPVVPQFL